MLYYKETDLAEFEQAVFRLTKGEITEETFLKIIQELAFNYGNYDYEYLQELLENLLLPDKLSAVLNKMFNSLKKIGDNPQISLNNIFQQEQSSNFTLSLELAEILEDLFALGGNHNTVRLLEIRNNLISFLSTEAVLLGCLTNADNVMARDAIRFIDANNIYAKTTNRITASTQIRPFLTRLIKSHHSWNIYELNMLIGAMNYTDHAEQAVALATKATKQIVNFRLVENIASLEGCLATNLCSRILYAKYFDDHVDVALDEQFDAWYLRLKQLARSNHNLDFILLVTKIRKAIFHHDQAKIEQYLEQLGTQYDETIVNIVKNGIQFYTDSKEYQALLQGGDV